MRDDPRVMDFTIRDLSVAGEAKLDPMHQFAIEKLFGTDNWAIAGHNIAFTNSSLWMALTTLVLMVFVGGGAKRELVPGRWQMAVESLAGFIQSTLATTVGPNGKKYVPYVFSLFSFILFANFLGLLPLGVAGVHAFTFTSHFSATGVLSVLSFAIVLVVGFARHKLHFFSLFVPHGTPAVMVVPIFFVELLSFLVRPFSLGLRLFVAMMAGHVLLEVLSSFVISGTNSGPMLFTIAALPSFVLMVGICALEILVAGIQAYVFALLTCVYLNDAENLH